MNLRHITNRLMYRFLTLAALAFSLSRPIQAQDAAAAAAPAAATPAAAAPAAGGADGALADAGKVIFEGRCKQCHAINDVVVGPALKDAHKRAPSIEKLEQFIKYPQKLINSDSYYKSVYDKYAPTIMPNHDDLKDADLDGIVAYIKQQSEAAPVAAAAGPAAAGDAAAGDASATGGVDNTLISYILIAFIFVLVAVVFVLISILNVLNRYLRESVELSEEEREFLYSKINWGAIFGSNAFRGALTILFIVVGTKLAFDQVYAIGIQKGYAPTQPIPFSHKLHAGQYKIDCGYCHTGAYRSKSATIPAVNICLNCHNAIKTGSPQMQKLYKAVENNRPIEWVRIHNLPDHAYFNHSQHTLVGGVKCQTCHGEIEKMEVVEQYSSLTMGWCINCHRETAVAKEVKFGGSDEVKKINTYYDKLFQAHEQKGTGKPMTVADIGGLECSKCHY